jgi:predicted phosphodiesterase
VRYLVLSDLHSNWEALQAVLADAAGSYDAIVSCGDLVGYGPDPNRIVDWARLNLHTVIRGNHDRACAGMDDIEWFNPVAQTATRWTMAKLTPENADFLRKMSPGPVVVEDFVLVHGSPLDEDEYVVSLADASNVFPYLEAGLTFFGHTHLQGGFIWSGEEQWALATPTAPHEEVVIDMDPEAVWMVNPGSVGQPRDGDPRAAYALYDSEARQLRLRRVAYDTVVACARVIDAGLPEPLGTRLSLGR